MQVDQAGELKKLLEERFPMVNYLAEGKPLFRLEQVYTMFCGAVAGVKPKKVLNLVAQQLNEGKQIERALADALEQLQNGRATGTSTEE